MTWGIGSLQKGLVLHLPLDGQSFNPATKRFTDKSAYSNHGTGNGTQLGSATPSFQADHMGQLVRAAPFNGSNDYINCGNDDVLNFITSDFTISMWIKKITLDSNEMLFARGGYIADGYELYATDNNILRFRTYQVSAKQTTDSSTFEIAEWVYTSITRTGAVAKIYINSVDKTYTSEAHIDPVTTTRTANIGIRSDGVTLSFTGNMSDVRVYNRALSQQEITLLYESYRVR